MNETTEAKPLRLRTLDAANGRKTSEKRRPSVQAKDLKPGWWFSKAGGQLQMAIRLRACQVEAVGMEGGMCVIQYVLHNAEVTHHPECTGWDWQIPKRIKLEVGKRYVQRNGKTTGVMRSYKDPVYPFCDGFDWWTSDGKWKKNWREHDRDIVSEYVEPKPVIDPGEGWRLLGDDDVIERGDEFRNRDGEWCPCRLTVGDRVHIAADNVDRGLKAIFRRRIAPAHIPFTPATFLPHADRWISPKDVPTHWFIARGIKPESVLLGSLWVEWDRLLERFEFVGGGVCGEVKE